MVEILINWSSTGQNLVLKRTEDTQESLMF